MHPGDCWQWPAWYWPTAWWDMAGGCSSGDGEHAAQDFGTTRNPVGAKLARDRGGSVWEVLAVQAPSRASPLPLWIAGVHDTLERREILWEQSLLAIRSEEHTSELQSLMRISYAVFCLKKKKNNN